MKLKSGAPENVPRPAVKGLAAVRLPYVVWNEPFPFFLVVGWSVVGSAPLSVAQRHPGATSGPSFRQDITASKSSFMVPGARGGM